MESCARRRRRTRADDIGEGGAGRAPKLGGGLRGCAGTFRWIRRGRAGRLLRSAGRAPAVLRRRAFVARAPSVSRVTPETKPAALPVACCSPDFTPPCVSASLPSPWSSSPAAPSPDATRPARRAPSATSTAPTSSPSSSLTPRRLAARRRRRRAPRQPDVVRHLLGQRDRPVRRQPRRRPLARDARRDGHARPRHVHGPRRLRGELSALFLPRTFSLDLRPGLAADAHGLDPAHERQPRAVRPGAVPEQRAVSGTLRIRLDRRASN